MSQANTAEIGSYVIVEPDNQSSYMKGFPPPADKVIARFRDGLTEDQYRWAFQNMSKITSVEPVNRGSGGITVLPYSNGHLLDETFTAPDGKNQSLKSLLRMMKVDGFIVLKNGTIRTEAYYNGLTPHTHHIIFSVTKSMVGTLTGVLIDDAMVKRQNFASEYLPELQGSAMGQATVQQLLDMTASVEWNHDRSNNDSEVRLNSMAGNFTARPEEFPFSNTLEFIQSLKPKNEHGLNYVYNPANTEALGWIITRVKQRNWQDVFAEQIWSRLGAEHDLLLTVDPQGHGFATAGANATLRDLARFGLMLEQQGYFNGEQIISQTWVDDIRNGDEFAHAAFRQSPERRRLGHQAFYRNQFRVLNSQAGEFFALGAFGQMIYINMEQDIVGVFLSTNLARSASANQVSLIRQIADAIAVE
jgi:CubicO group peptidase (beta-lactamase class C family)